MGYITMCGPKGYGFPAILDINDVINRVSILAISVSNKVSGFLLSILRLGEFLGRSYTPYSKMATILVFFCLLVN